MKKLFLLVIVFVLAACSAQPSSEFDNNMSKWEKAGISHYRYVLFISCFCPFTEDMPLTIEVKDGVVISMTSSDGTPVSPTDPSYGTYETYSTIDRIFLNLKADLTGEADEVAVTYDSAYGFPLSISVDQIKEAIDDEFYIQITEFVVLE